ncbi:hypothetical protein BDW66DRAFT_132904 [Aspergillus desertorum]
MFPAVLFCRNEGSKSQHSHSQSRIMLAPLALSLKFISFSLLTSCPILALIITP